MATSRYDLPLDEIVKKNGNRKRTNNNKFNSTDRNKLQRRNLSDRIGFQDRAQSNQKRPYNNSYNNNARNQKTVFTNKNLNTKISTKQITNRGGITSRLGIPGKQNINVVAGGNSIKLFTKHYDARAKIKAKQTKNTNAKGNTTSGLPKTKGLIKTTLESNKKNPNKNSNPSSKRQNKQTYLQKSKENSHQKKQAKPPPNNRESLFTGKSIKIVAKNDLSVREKRALLKGSTITPLPAVVKKNKQTKQTNSRYESPAWQRERPLLQFSTSTSYDSSAVYQQEDSSLLSPVKKSVPAKVVISNLHPNVTHEDIRELFGAIGNLSDSRITSVGTAECVYTTAEDAFAAYTKYHTRNLDGQPMVLKILNVDTTPPALLPNSTPIRANSSRHAPPQFSFNAHNAPLSPFMSGSRASVNNATGAGGKPVVFTVKL